MCSRGDGSACRYEPSVTAAVLAFYTSYDEEWTDRDGHIRVKHVVPLSMKVSFACVRPSPQAAELSTGTRDGRGRSLPVMQRHRPGLAEVGPFVHVVRVDTAYPGQHDRFGRRPASQSQGYCRDHVVLVAVPTCS